MSAPFVLVGATASGKSAVALELARRRPGVEIVSADAMAVYRGMDIGTAKPTTAEQAEVPHHGIDVADPTEEYAVVDHQRRARRAIADIERRGGRVVVVGGSGLYVRSLVDDLSMPGRYPEVAAELETEPDTGRLHARLQQLDPVAAARTTDSNRRRIVRALEVTLGSGEPFSSFGPGIDVYPPTRFRQVGLRLPRTVLDRRIEARYHRQLADGFLDEVARLASDELSRTARQALGYKELLEHLEGRLSLDEAIDLAIRRTRRFARRQQRWFERDRRIVWIDADDNPMDLLPEVLGQFDAAVGRPGDDRSEVSCN